MEHVLIGEDPRNEQQPIPNQNWSITGAELISNA